MTIRARWRPFRSRTLLARATTRLQLLAVRPLDPTVTDYAAMEAELADYRARILDTVSEPALGRTDNGMGWSPTR